MPAMRSKVQTDCRSIGQLFRYFVRNVPDSSVRFSAQDRPGQTPVFSPHRRDRHQRFDRCCRWAPGGEEGEIAISDISTDQQTSRPKTMICAVKFSDLEIGQFEIAPIMQPRSFGSGPLPTGVSNRTGAASGRCPRPCRRQIAACPRIETHERC